MDAELLRLRAHADQNRPVLRDMLKKPEDPAAIAAIIRMCATGKLGEFDERVGKFVGMLAIVAIADLLEPRQPETEEA